MKYLHVEVKICEGCGVLWLRRTVNPSNYCCECSAKLAQFPRPVGSHPGGRPRLPRRTGCAAAHRSRRSGGAA